MCVRDIKVGELLHGRICDSGRGGMTCSLLGFVIAPSSFHHTAPPTTASAFAKATACLPSLLRISCCCFANTRPPVPALLLAPGLPWQLLPALAPFPPPASCLHEGCCQCYHQISAAAAVLSAEGPLFFFLTLAGRHKSKSKWKPNQNKISSPGVHVVLLTLSSSWSGSWEFRGSQDLRFCIILLVGFLTILGKLEEGEYREERFRGTAFIIIWIQCILSELELQLD